MLLRFIFFVVLLIISFAFISQNSDVVTINMYPEYSIELPVFVIFFAGIIIGGVYFNLMNAISYCIKVFKLKRKNKNEIKNIEKELSKIKTKDIIIK